MMNQKFVLLGFSKYFLRHFLMKTERLLIFYDDFSNRPTIKEFFYCPELYAQKVGKIIF